MASQSWIDKDFYGVLGVQKDASADDIKKAYRKLALELHPDRNPDQASQDRFKDVGEAYGVLSDVDKRAEYDRLRDAMASGQGGFGRGFNVSDFGFGDEFRVDDLLNQIFGGQSPFSGGRVHVSGGSPFGGSPFGPQKGRDVETTAALSFDEAVEGAERTIRSPRGRTVTVKIPAGVSDGARIRVRGRGEPAPQGGQPGDLFVRVEVGQHPFFGRKDQHLTLDLPITFKEAAMGAEVKVPTLNGAVTLKIPAGTSSGQTFRLRGKGVTSKSGTSDLLATVQVVVPQKLSTEEQELVEHLPDESPRSHLGV